MFFFFFKKKKSCACVAHILNTSTFVYCKQQPTYQIKNKKDLLELLNAKKDEGGMDMKDLKDSYQKLNDAVEVRFFFFFFLWLSGDFPLRMFF